MPLKRDEYTGEQKVAKRPRLSCPDGTEGSSPVATMPPARGTKRVGLPHGSIGGTEGLAAAAKRRRLAVQTLLEAAMDQSQLPTTGDSGTSTQTGATTGFSGDGDVLMDTVSGRPPGLDLTTTTTTGADRASSAGQDPSSGT